MATQVRLANHIRVDNSTTQGKNVVLSCIFRLYLTIFISAVPGKWSESRDLAWSRDTKIYLYTGGFSRSSSRFNDGLLYLMLMAFLTLHLMSESSGVKNLVFCGSILYPVCKQCPYMAELNLAMCSFSLCQKSAQFHRCSHFHIVTF